MVRHKLVVVGALQKRVEHTSDRLGIVKEHQALACADVVRLRQPLYRHLVHWRDQWERAPQKKSRR